MKALKISGVSELIDDGPMFKALIWDELQEFERRVSGYPGTLPEYADGDIADDNLDYVRGWFELAVSQFFIGARKLAESHKLSISNEARKYSFEWYPARDSGVLPDKMTIHRYREYYEIDNPRSAALQLRELANQVIHSRILEPEFAILPEGGIEMNGFHLASDRECSRGILWIPWDCIREIANLLLTDDIVHSRHIRDGRGEFVQISQSAEDLEKPQAQLHEEWLSIAGNRNSLKRLKKSYLELSYPVLDIDKILDDQN
ncbi:hypothetical protein [Rhodococcus sp. Q]|uniref:hypothetical protein n=1 Tax=Rhodococcus sp. Q TaxID=2502252 RepID=UPI0010F68A66|nr:hypothetical protein [Rhodococcus sp. Q]